MGKCTYGTLDVILTVGFFLQMQTFNFLQRSQKKNIHQKPNCKTESHFYTNMTMYGQKEHTKNFCFRTLYPNRHC